jgi:medium-chain acyl-[acyl-carrier-protein] hydrolase
MRSVEPLLIDYLVRGFDCGFGGPLRTLPMANFLQEAAGASAQQLGFGIPDLNARNQTWMLAKADFRIFRLPREGERIRARTWPSGLDRLLALRDIALEGEDGQPLVGAVYAYLVVDLEARRPLRPERAIPALAEIDVASLGHCVPDFRLGCAFPPGSPSDFSFRQTASHRHLDDNGHVNNAHILDWLVDAASAPSDSAVDDRLAGIRVDFLKEVLLGEEVELFRGGELLDDSGPGAPLLVTPVEMRRGGEAVARAELSRRPA